MREGVKECVDRLEGGRKLCGRVTGKGGEEEEESVRGLWFGLLDVMVQSVTTCRKWFSEEDNYDHRFLSFFFSFLFFFFSFLFFPFFFFFSSSSHLPLLFFSHTHTKKNEISLKQQIKEETTQPLLDTMKTTMGVAMACVPLDLLLNHLLGHGDGALPDFLPKILAMFENFKYEVGDCM